MGNSPCVMISSTFFDLQQVRSDLYRFIKEDLGYLPLASEHSSFPVDPSLETIDNCRTQVQKNADIMILIIGGRYGSIDTKTNKSITNLEFLTAREKGIPIYVFVEKSIMTILPLWENNPDSDFKSVADTPLLFEFISDIRKHKRVWVFPFEDVIDIIKTLRFQFGYLFRDALDLHNRIKGRQFPSFMKTLSPQSLRIALEKPVAWEYILLLQCLADNISDFSNLLREYKAELRIEMAEFIPADNAFDWIQTRLHELEGYANSGNTLFSKCVKEAFGEPGVEADAEYIVWVAHMLAEIYVNSLNWARRIRCARVEEPFDRLAREMALFVDNLIQEFNNYPLDSLAKIKKALETANIENPEQIELTFTLELANQDRFNEVLNEIHHEFISGKRK